MCYGVKADIFEYESKSEQKPRFLQIYQDSTLKFNSKIDGLLMADLIPSKLYGGGRESSELNIIVRSLVMISN